MGVPPVIIHSRRMFSYKPSMHRGSPISGNPHIGLQCMSYKITESVISSQISKRQHPGLQWWLFLRWPCVVATASCFPADTLCIVNTFICIVRLFYIISSVWLSIILIHYNGSMKWKCFGLLDGNFPAPLESTKGASKRSSLVSLWIWMVLDGIYTIIHYYMVLSGLYGFKWFIYHLFEWIVPSINRGCHTGYVHIGHVSFMDLQYYFLAINWC